MERLDIEKKVNSFLSERLGFDKKLIDANSHLRADLGLTSLDMQEIRLFCRQTFGFVPDRKDMLTLNLLRDVYELIERKQA